MRSLLVDIYPPNLHTVGLESALRDLLSPLQAQGIESKLEVSPDLRLAPATERLLFVTAREAIRNVARHADAHAANVRVVHRRRRASSWWSTTTAAASPQTRCSRRARTATSAWHC